MLLREKFIAVRQRTKSICAPLAIEDHIPQPEAFVSPPKWHLAHTTWFFEQMVLRHFHPAFEVYDVMHAFLFNSYYNHLGDRTERVARGHRSRHAWAAARAATPRIALDRRQIYFGHPTDVSKICRRCRLGNGTQSRCRLGRNAGGHL